MNPAETGVDVVRCPTDPEVETAVRCSRCGQPICPRCLIQTPVGARCKSCAQMRKLPMFEVSALDYLKAVAIALPAGAALGLVWGLVPFGGFFAFFIAFGVGYGLGEIMSRALRRKKSLGLQTIAGFGVLVATIVRLAAPGLITQFPSLPGMGAALIIGAAGIATNPLIWLLIAIGVFGAVIRFRQ